MKATRESAFARIRGWVRPRQRAAQAGSRKAVVEMEGVVEGALSPVRTPDPFRRDLSANLSLAAQRRVAGLAVAQAPPRMEWTWGISAGLLAAMVVMLIVALWPRPVTRPARPRASAAPATRPE